MVRPNGTPARSASLSPRVKIPRRLNTPPRLNMRTNVPVLALTPEAAALYDGPALEERGPLPATGT